LEIIVVTVTVGGPEVRAADVLDAELTSLPPMMLPFVFAELTAIFR
jgi:hypothetical protein